MSLSNILKIDLFLWNSNGNPSRIEKNKIFISQQTHKGLKVTASSITND